MVTKLVPASGAGAPVVPDPLVCGTRTDARGNGVVERTPAMFCTSAPVSLDDRLRDGLQAGEKARAMHQLFEIYAQAGVILGACPNRLFAVTAIAAGAQDKQRTNGAIATTVGASSSGRRRSSAATSRPPPNSPGSRTRWMRSSRRRSARTAAFNSSALQQLPHTQPNKELGEAAAASGYCAQLGWVGRHGVP